MYPPHGIICFYPEHQFFLGFSEAFLIFLFIFFIQVQYFNIYFSFLDKKDIYVLYGNKWIQFSHFIAFRCQEILNIELCRIYPLLFTIILVISDTLTMLRFPITNSSSSELITYFYCENYTFYHEGEIY